MADDVWTVLAKGCLAFSHSHVARIVATTFKGADSLVGSLFDKSPPGTTKVRLDQQTSRTRFEEFPCGMKVAASKQVSFRRCDFGQTRVGDGLSPREFRSLHRRLGDRKTQRPRRSFERCFRRRAAARQSLPAARFTNREKLSEAPSSVET
jgi:hypothetical protein